MFNQHPITISIDTKIASDSILKDNEKLQKEKDKIIADIKNTHVFVIRNESKPIEKLKLGILKELFVCNAPFLKNLELDFNVDLSSIMNGYEIIGNTQLTSVKIYLGNSLINLSIYPESYKLHLLSVYCFSQANQTDIQRLFYDLIRNVRMYDLHLMQLRYQRCHLHNIFDVSIELNPLIFGSLTALALDNCGLTERDVLSMARFLKIHRPALSNISLSNNKIGEKAAAAIILSLAYQSEVSLDLSNTGLDDSRPIAFALQENNKFKYLNFSDNFLVEILDKLFEALLQCHNLAELNISHFACGIYTVFNPSVQLAVTQLFRRHENLRKVTLSRTELSGDRFSAMIKAILEGNSVIESLDVSGNLMENESVYAVADLIQQNKNLSSLNLERIYLDTYSCRRLRKALEKNHTLCNLVIDPIIPQQYREEREAEMCQIKRLCEDNKRQRDKKARDWARISLLISFIRANSEHPFKNSIIPLIRNILELAEIDRIEKTADKSENYAVVLRENKFSLAMGSLTWLYISNPFKIMGLSKNLSVEAYVGSIFVTLFFSGVSTMLGVSTYTKKRMAKPLHDYFQEAVLINATDFSQVETLVNTYGFNRKHELGFLLLTLKHMLTVFLPHMINVNFLYDLDKKFGYPCRNTNELLRNSLSCYYFTNNVLTAIPVAALIMGAKHKQPQHKEKIHTAMWLIMSGKLLNDFVYLLRQDSNASSMHKISAMGLFGICGLSTCAMYWSERNKISRNLRYPISLFKYYVFLLNDGIKNGANVRENLQYYFSSLKNLTLRSVTTTKTVNETCKKTKPLLLSRNTLANFKNRASEQTAAAGTGANTHTTEHGNQKPKPKSRCSSCVVM